MNYRSIGSRIDKLDGGYAQSNEATLFVVPEGDTPPAEYNPGKHSIIWDTSKAALPAYGLSKFQLGTLMAEIDGKTRSVS